jgi:hypothetical protein
MELAATTYSQYLFSSFPLRALLLCALCALCARLASEASTQTKALPIFEA